MGVYARLYEIKDMGKTFDSRSWPHFIAILWHFLNFFLNNAQNFDVGLGSIFIFHLFSNSARLITKSLSS